MEAFLSILFISTLLLATGNSAKVSYHGDEVIRIRPNSSDQVKTVAKLVDDNECSTPALQKMWYWSRPRNANSSFDVHVRSVHVNEFVTKLYNASILHSIHVSDIQQLIESTSRITNQSGSTNFNSTVYGNFSSHGDINKWMKWLCKTQPKLTKCGNAGRSTQRRDIDFIKLGSRKRLFKREVLIFGGIHGREWLSPASLIVVISKIVTSYGKFAAVTRLLDNYDLHFLPVVNPDGYEYSRSQDRLWSKNRKDSSFSCPGVDLNRNFEYQWKSNCRCNSQYAGWTAGSETETKTIRDYATYHMRKLFAVFSIQSYSRRWLLPYGYSSTKQASDYKELLRVALIASKPMKFVNGRSYLVEGISGDYYKPTGDPLDNFKGNKLAKYTYAIEVGNDGFLAAVPEILKSGNELFTGLLYAVSSMKH